MYVTYNFQFLPFLYVQFSDIKYIDIVQTHHHNASNGTLILQNSSQITPTLLVPDNKHCVSCPYDFDYSKHSQISGIIRYLSFSIILLSIMSSSFIHVEAYIRISLHFNAKQYSSIYLNTHTQTCLPVHKYLA